VKPLNMYIRQTSLFSFEEIIKFQQQTKLELILWQIDISKLAKELRKSSTSRGIKKVKVHALLNCIALIAGTIAINTTKSKNKAA